MYSKSLHEILEQYSYLIFKNISIIKVRKLFKKDSSYDNYCVLEIIFRSIIKEFNARSYLNKAK